MKTKTNKEEKQLFNKLKKKTTIKIKNIKK